MIKKNMVKKIISSLLLFSLLAFFLLTPIAKAAEEVPPGPWYNQTFDQWFSKVYDDSNPDEIFGERYTAAQVQWIIYSLPSIVITAATGNDANLILCIMNKEIGDCVDGIAEKVSLLYTPIAQIEDGDNPVTALSLIFSPTRPLSGVNYVRGLAGKLNIIPEAHAQGFGFQGLNPVLKAWQVFRNITYALFILIVIAIAFMIMFRVKISPQTVITIQSALPRIVITIILVTFSYAIAGFLIDLIYVVIGLLAWVISSSGIFIGGNWSEVFWGLTSGPLPEIGGGIFGWIVIFLVFFFFGIFIAWFGSTGLIGVIAPALAFGAAVLFTGGTILPIFGFLGFLLLLVIAVLLIVHTFRIVWLMLKTYVSILLLVIFAPVQIGIGALIPGIGFGNWLRSMAANLAVYPTVGMLIALSFMFLRSAYAPFADEIAQILGTEVAESPLGTEGGWTPPLTFGAGLLPLLWLGASFVIFLIIPKTADMIKSLIEGKPLAYGTAITEAFGAPLGVGRAGFLFGAESRIQATLKKAEHAGRRYGLDIAAARTLRKVLGLRS